MIRVALAGGIGSGKSAATAYLRRRGYVVADADEAAREVVRAPLPAWRALIDAFGTAVLDDRGEIDRPFLAAVVFADVTARRRLEAITHPPIAAALRETLDRATGQVAFVVLPLFRPEHRLALGLDEVWAIEVDSTTALARLTGPRGLDENDARARLDAQMSNEERRALVDRVIVNGGSIEELERALDGALAEAGRVRA